MFITKASWLIVKDELESLRAQVQARDQRIAELTDRLLAKEQVPLAPSQIDDMMLRDIKRFEEKINIFEDQDGGDIGDSVEMAFRNEAQSAKNNVEEFTRE